MIRHLYVPLTQPEDVIPHLAKQELHWKAGYSAQELAITWANTGSDFPASVRRVLDSAPEYVQADLVDGFFEREVELGTKGRNSQTDLTLDVYTQAVNSHKRAAQSKVVRMMVPNLGETTRVVHPQIAR